jgi:hypothetical protein
MRHRNNASGIFFVGVIVIIAGVMWLATSHPAILIAFFILIAVGVIVFFIKKQSGNGNSPETSRGKDREAVNEFNGCIDVSDEVKKEVADMVEFVHQGRYLYLKDTSKKYQRDIFCQIYSLETEIVAYENLVHPIFEKETEKINTYQLLDPNERSEQTRFAFAELCVNIDSITKDKTNARKYFSAMDNLSARLVQINAEKFKKLFYLIHEYHFWYVYNYDEDYAFMLKTVLSDLKLYHGIRQTDFYKKTFKSKDSISHTLYFAEKAGKVVRVPEGRTYRLYLPEDNIDEIPKFEYSRACIYDGDFDYKAYWKNIEKVLKKNMGILQTEFYAKFEWDIEITRQALKDAEKDKKVIREKKGNTYLLYLSEIGRGFL